MSSHVIPSNQASGAYRRLEFTNFDAPMPQASQQAEPSTPAAPARVELAPGVPLPTADEIDALQQAAWKEGYAVGYDEGSARGRLEAAELHQLLQSFNGALADFDQEVAEELQALALEIARQVIRDSLKLQPESILTVIREALVQLPQQQATILLHPEDAALVRQYLGESLAASGNRIHEEESIDRGGCLIEAAGGQVDAQIATRWRRIVESVARSAPGFNDE